MGMVHPPMPVGGLSNHAYQIWIRNLYHPTGGLSNHGYQSRIGNLYHPEKGAGRMVPGTRVPRQGAIPAPGSWMNHHLTLVYLCQNPGWLSRVAWYPGLPC